MPKIVKPPAKAAPTPSALPPTPDFNTPGMAVALADLAAQLGMTVEQTVSLPDRIKGAGLPFPVPSGLARAAHKIDRDRIDGMLWRCHGRRVNEPIPVVPRAQAIAQVESAETVRKTGVVTVTAPDAESLL